MEILLTYAMVAKASLGALHWINTQQKRQIIGNHCPRKLVAFSSNFIGKTESLWVRLKISETTRTTGNRRGSVDGNVDILLEIVVEKGPSVSVRTTTSTGGLLLLRQWCKYVAISLRWTVPRYSTNIAYCKWCKLHFAKGILADL